MTHDDYRLAIEKLGLSQVQAAKLFGANERTSRRWATGEHDIPVPVEIILRLMLRYRISPDEVRLLMNMPPKRKAG
jgi:hypothetical protein